MAMATAHASRPETFQALVGDFASFLTVAVHIILYERDLYPKASFLTAKAYGFPVRQSRHPRVCAWVRHAVAAVAAELLKGTVARVALVVYHPKTSRPLERFVWDVSGWPSIPESEVHATIVRAERPQQAPHPLDLDEQFRAVLSRLSTCSSRLAPIPPKCAFTLVVELKEDADTPAGHSKRWIPSEPESQRTRLNAAEGEEARTTAQAEADGSVKRGQDVGGDKVLPLRRVDAGEMRFGMWVEEGQAKNESHSLQGSGVPSNLQT